MIPLTLIAFKRRLYYMKYRFQRLNRFWRFIILALLGVLLWIWVWNASNSSRSYDGATSPEIHKTVQQVVAHYCNFPMRTTGAEGSLSFEKLLNQQRFRLEMAQVLIRHGDRTPAMFIPNMDNGNFDYDCTFKTSDSDHKQMFEEYTQATKHISTHEIAKGVNTAHHLLPSGHRCRIGQLTKKGFLQHFALGKHMRSAYSSLINTGIKSSDLHVRSTRRTRCAQSAAAFLYGLLTKDVIMREGLTINISSGIWFHEDDDGIPYKCPSLTRRWDEYKQRSEHLTGAEAMEPIMQQFSRLLRTPRPSLPTIIFLTDAIYTRFCYNYPLPCGPGGCVTEEMAAQAMDFATWAFVDNYTGIADVATHPMLIQIAKRMINKVQSKSALKFVLYSGHDSTVTPLLLNLGVHDQKRWTPYATRVAFELWRDTHEDSSKQQSSLDNFYFRVIVNGKRVTSKMRFCGDALVKGELCPLKELVSWLSDGAGFEGMDESYKTLCSQDSL
ncbi:2-phosphoxylose phosphatase 1-like isoform X2 [Oculina patagonica]